MNSRRIDNLLKQATMLQNGCDVDLLLFFRRHPHVLLTGDQLTRYLGYDIHQVGNSLERMIAGGFIRKSQHAAHPARMYRLSNGSGDDDGALDALLELASTPDGRRAVIKALRGAAASGPGAVSGPAPDGTAPVRPRRVH